jgi:hypothetical protein
VGFVVDKAALKQVFSGYFDFSCRFSFHQVLHTYLPSRACTIGQIVADVPSGLIVSLTPPQETKENEKGRRNKRRRMRNTRKRGAGGEARKENGFEKEKDNAEKM